MPPECERCGQFMTFTPHTCPPVECVGRDHQAHNGDVRLTRVTTPVGGNARVLLCTRHRGE